MTTTSGTAPAGPDPRLAARLADPELAAAVVSLLDHADLLALLVEGLDGLVARTEVIGESLVDGLGEVRGAVATAGTDLELDVPALLVSLVRLARVLPVAAPGMVAAVESGVLDRVLSSDLVEPAALDQVGVLARGLVRGGEDFTARPVQVNGLLAVRRVLADPDVRRALSFVATVAKALGRELAGPSAGPV